MKNGHGPSGLRYYVFTLPAREVSMAKKKDKLTEVSTKIGAALGKAEKQTRLHARKVAEVRAVAKQELKLISRQVDSLRKQLAKTSDRLKKVLVS
jgi:hypothetical protein